MVQSALKLTQFIMNDTVRHLLDTTVVNNGHALLVACLATVFCKPLLCQAIEGTDKQLIQGRQHQCRTANRLCHRIAIYMIKQVANQMQIDRILHDVI